MLLVVDMERKLTESGTDFNLTYWDQGVYKYIHLKCIITPGGCYAQNAWPSATGSHRLTEKPQRDRRAKVREAVQEAESVYWRKTATEKPALSLYSKAKQAIEKEPMYENSKGSGLFCARQMRHAANPTGAGEVHAQP
ncbi:hypothetical protein HPB52_009176 [Rhipicephalus sanguineus]|uniref:Uncharacterized protein n=1 Tax=Rhipicephalus sanguineus TaxID=34632 RepID=A0A9D4PK10_RHISA|nr:hypothetical protein HPB52_009176 [Rhipicephalus sanguineus]